MPEDYRKNRARAQLALLALVLLGAGCATTLEPGPQGLGASELTADRFTHTVFDGVLREFVDSEGRVEYARLAEESTALDRYYASLARRSPDSHPALFRNDSERLAYWINAYNAAVLKLVLAHYPIASVKDVPPVCLRTLSTYHRISGLLEAGTRLVKRNTWELGFVTVTVVLDGMGFSIEVTVR